MSPGTSLLPLSDPLQPPSLPESESFQEAGLRLDHTYGWHSSSDALGTPGKPEDCFRAEDEEEST